MLWRGYVLLVRESVSRSVRSQGVYVVTGKRNTPTQMVKQAAEGSWILRCRCKHKHTDHDPVSKACRKPGCGCVCFISPWVCNCNHPWSDHKQVVVQRKVLRFKVATGKDDGKPAGHGGVEVAVPDPESLDINRWDLVKRGDTT